MKAIKYDPNHTEIKYDLKRKRILIPTAEGSVFEDGFFNPDFIELSLLLERIFPTQRRRFNLETFGLYWSVESNIVCKINYTFRWGGDLFYNKPIFNRKVLFYKHDTGKYVLDFVNLEDLLDKFSEQTRDKILFNLDIFTATLGESTNAN